MVQAGAIATKGVGRERRFLLVAARRDPQIWIFPKGHVELGERLQETALRELREEAGVEGEVVRQVGSLCFRSGQEDVEVIYFLVRSVREWESSEQRAMRWLCHDEAAALLTFDDAKHLLRRVADELEEP